MSRTTSAPVTKIAKPTVLVWQSYGTTRVHPCETADHLTAIIAEISTIVADWGVDDSLDAMTSAVKRFVEKGMFVRARNEITSFCRQHNDHETFEVFEFCTVQELM